MFVFMANSINIIAFSQIKTNKSINIMEFKITIISLYFGRDDNKTIISQDSISSQEKIHKSNKEKNIRKLTKTEKEKLNEFLSDFPLQTLKKSYVNRNVKDGIQMKFIIEINNNSKEIFVANVFQEDLGKLVALISPMLPDNFYMYKKTNIYPY